MRGLTFPVENAVTRRAMAIVVALVIALPLAAHADEYQDDLRARRARLMEQLGPTTLLVAWSAEPKVYSLDVDYEYRQDSNLLYLTGIDQPETMLVLMPGNRTRKEILFVREPDARREHWEGHTLTKAEAAARSGIDTVYFSGELDAFIVAMFNGQPYGFPRRVQTDEFDVFFEAVSSDSARLAMFLGPAPATDAALTREYVFANKAKERFLGVSILDASPLVARLRQVKTPYEQKVLARSLEISIGAHMAGMEVARPGRFEYEVEAAIEHAYLANGAMSWGYPSIVGSGPNATILHYNASRRRMEDGDLLLVDAAGSYQGLTGDITRTYPVNGRFTDAQRDIYRLVLAAQEAGRTAVRAGKRTADIERAAEEVVRQGLLELGLITDASGDQFRLWYTHGICHWIGMDVHDVGSYDRSLEPGMTFVIEPGLYVREAALDALEDTPENRAFIEAVTPAVAKYQDIGVRIEDSFLLTEEGLQCLSCRVPKTIEEVERFLGGSGSTGTRPPPRQR